MAEQYGIKTATTGICTKVLTNVTKHPLCITTIMTEMTDGEETSEEMNGDSMTEIVTNMLNFAHHQEPDIRRALLFC